MAIVTKSRPAAPLTLSADVWQIVTDADKHQEPCVLTIAGSSDFELRTFRVVATGSVTPKAPGYLTLALLGLANAPHAPSPSLDPNDWLILAESPLEPMGGPDDPPSTQWMVQGTRMMFYLASGKMQGEYSTNVASHPSAALTLMNPLTGLVKGVDPLCYFAVAAMFAPNGEMTDDEAVVQLAHFQLGSEI